MQDALFDFDVLEGIAQASRRRSFRDGDFGFLRRLDRLFRRWVSVVFFIGFVRLVQFRIRRARILGAFVTRQRTDHQIDSATYELGREIGMAERRDLFDELLDDLKADFGVRHFATTKFQGDFHLHVFAQEIDGVLHFDAEIMRVNARA